MANKEPGKEVLIKEAFGRLVYIKGLDGAKTYFAHENIYIRERMPIVKNHVKSATGRGTGGGSEHA